MDGLTLLRILNLLIWSGLLLYMLPGAKSAIMGRDTRRGDPMRLGLSFVCLVIIGGNLRFLLAPDSDGLWMAIYLLSAAVGLYLIRLGNAYGRGPRL